jgi:hypothetical protein
MGVSPGVVIAPVGASDPGTVYAPVFGNAARVGQQHDNRGNCGIRGMVPGSTCISIWRGSCGRRDALKLRTAVSSASGCTSRPAAEILPGVLSGVTHVDPFLGLVCLGTVG